MNNIIGFLHIPKTAGGTINAIMARNYDESEIFRIISKPSYKYYIEGLKKDKLDRNKIKIVFGHYSFGAVKYFPDDVRMVSMMRRPIDRVVSYYQWAKGGNNHFLSEEINKYNYTLNDCIENKISIELNNGQTRLMSGLDMHEDKRGDSWSNVKFGSAGNDMLSIAKDNVNDRFEFIGLQEYFYISLWMFQELFGWDVCEYGNKNVTSEKDKIKVEDDHLIKEYNSLDTELYEYVLMKFKKDVSFMDGHDYVTDEDLSAFNVECESRLRKARVVKVGKKWDLRKKVKHIIKTVLSK